MTIVVVLINVVWFVKITMSYNDILETCIVNEMFWLISTAEPTLF
jgi:hypothetical protein